MLTHNLKIAIRNLLKYKLQTTISVLSIAIGIVVFATVHSIMQLHLQPPQISKMHYYDRACVLHLYPKQSGERNADKVTRVNADIIRALRFGGLQSVEIGPTFISPYAYGWDMKFSLGDTLERNFMVNGVVTLENSYPHYAGYRSLYTGRQIAILKAEEAIISENMAKRIFGDTNPIGASIEGGESASRRLTIVDVYRNASHFDGMQGNLHGKNALFYALDDETFMRNLERGNFPTKEIYVVMKQGFTLEQMLREINIALAPLSLEAEAALVKNEKAEEMATIRTTRIVSYLLGSLILLAACICYLRMQIQLFAMRNRELSLRIVNGAKRRHLFALLMTEVALVVVGASVLSLLLGIRLENSINTLFIGYFGVNYTLVENLLHYSILTGIAIMLICCIIVWLTLARICRNAQGLAANMRGSRNHTFRNTMLWFQVTVGMLFIGAALVMTTICNRSLQNYALPEEEAIYRESIIIKQRSNIKNINQLYEELNAHPDIALRIPLAHSMITYDEINDNFMQKVGVNCLKTYELQDSTLLDFYNISVSWFKPELKGEPCILVHEELYPILESTGVLANGMLSRRFGDTSPLPVAGTFKGVQYETKDESLRTNFIILNHKEMYIEYIIVPVKGKYTEVWNFIQNRVTELDPTFMNRIIFNLYEDIASEIEIFINIRKVGWILGCVALLVCIMGIYSTIALDTRARRKEVAIRKINGAKPKDIALLFARLYIIIIVSALAVLTPLASIIQHSFNNGTDKILKNLPVVNLAIAGCMIVIIIIAIIVAWQVRGIMKINPVEMIVKE